MIKTCLKLCSRQKFESWTTQDICNGQKFRSKVLYWQIFESWTTWDIWNGYEILVVESYQRQTTYEIKVFAA